MADKIPNDTFLLFGFGGVPVDLAHALDDVEARARSCPDLSLRVEQGGHSFVVRPASAVRSTGVAPSMASQSSLPWAIAAISDSAR